MADRKIDIWMYLRSQGVQQGAAQAKTALDGVKSAAAGLAAQLGVVGGIAAGGLFLRTAIREALEAEQINNRLRRTVTNLGADYSALKPRIDAVVQSMAAYAAVDDEDVSGALVKLIQLTGNYDASIKNLKLTLDIAAGAGVDFETAARGMANAIAGNPRGLMEFSAQMRRAIMALGEGATAADVSKVAMQQLSIYTGAAGDDANSAAGKFRTLTLAVVDLAQSLGELIIQLKVPELARFLAGEIRDVKNTFRGGLGFYGPNAVNPNADLPGIPIAGKAVRINPSMFPAPQLTGWQSPQDIYSGMWRDYGFNPGMPSPYIPGPTSEQLYGRKQPGAITDFFGSGAQGRNKGNIDIDKWGTELQARVGTMIADGIMVGFQRGGKAAVDYFGDLLKEAIARRIAEALAGQIVNGLSGGQLGLIGSFFGWAKG